MHTNIQNRVKKICAFILIALSISNALEYRVALVPFISESLKTEELSALEQKVYSELLKADNYSLLSPDNSVKKVRQSGLLYSFSDFAHEEIGELLDVDKLVTARVTLRKTGYSLEVYLLDSKSGIIEKKIQNESGTFSFNEVILDQLKSLALIFRSTDSSEGDRHTIDEMADLSNITFSEFAYLQIEPDSWDNQIYLNSILVNEFGDLDNFPITPGTYNLTMIKHGLQMNRVDITVPEKRAGKKVEYKIFTEGSRKATSRLNELRLGMGTQVILDRDLYLEGMRVLDLLLPFPTLELGFFTDRHLYFGALVHFGYYGGMFQFHKEWRPTSFMYLTAGFDAGFIFDENFEYLQFGGPEMRVGFRRGFFSFNIKGNLRYNYITIYGDEGRDINYDHTGYVRDIQYNQTGTDFRVRPSIGVNILFHLKVDRDKNGVLSRGYNSY